MTETEMSGMNEMSDDNFVQAFFSGAIPPTGFHHRDHLRLTWALLRQVGEDEATRRITSGIHHFAAAHGQAAKYHETMTRFWVRIVAHTMAARPDIASFEKHLATFPMLLEKELPYRHWRRETMLSSNARAHWVEPDVLALPM